MRNALSKTVFGLSWFAAVATVLFTLLWFSIVIDHDGRGAIATRSVVGPVWGVSVLVSALIPSAVFYALWRQRRDFWSLLLSGVSLLSVISEMAALFFVPLHGPW